MCTTRLWRTPLARPRIVLLRREEQDLPYNLGLIQRHAEVTVVDKGHLAAALEDAEALFLWDYSSTELQHSWGAAKNLKWIHVAAAGVDTILFDALRTSTITITNGLGVFDRPIAEFVLASILAHDKQLHLSKRLQQKQTWQHRDLTETAGKRALIVGTGGIGRAIARLLSAVGMEVRGIGRTARAGDAEFGSVLPFSELVQHAEWADHLVMAAPLTNETRHCVNEGLLASMKTSGHLVNVGRGALVNENDLLRALQHGQISAASLDVFEQEPLRSDHPFWGMENVHISAHMAGDVTGWQDDLADQFLENLLTFCSGDTFAVTIDKGKGYARRKLKIGSAG